LGVRGRIKQEVGRKLSNEKHGARYLPNIIRIIKSGRIRWAGHVAGIGEKRNAYGFSDGKTWREDTIWKT
jgi:hypothetical protein